MASAVRLVAERCFSLNEIVVVDMKDAGGESVFLCSLGFLLILF